MALSPAEQQELAQLESKYGGQSSSSKLTPQEQEELKALESKYGKKEERPWYSVSKEGLIRGAANALPVAGSIGGGLLGALEGGVGAIPGAMGGGAAGEAAKKIVERYFLDAPPETVGKMAKDIALSGAAGGVGEGMGQIIAGPIARSFAKSGVKDIAQDFARPGADAVKSAAQALSVKPTQGMLTDDYIVRNLENSLAQSPSLPGSMVRSEQRPVWDAINDASKMALKDASMQSEVQAGKNIKKGVGDYFENRYEPIKQSYQEIESHTSNIPINEKGLARISNNIRKLEDAKFKGSEGNQIANQFADWLSEAKSVNDIKILKTKARRIAEDPNSTYEAKSVATSIMDKLDQAQSNTITRQAVQIAREAPIDKTSSGKFLNKSQKAAADLEAEAEGKDIGRRLIGDIKGTNKQYRELMTDVKKFGQGSGLTKGKQGRGMAATLNDIREANPQDAASALFDSGNIEFTQWVKQKMPAEFEIARQQRVSEIAQKSMMPNGSISPRKLQVIVEKMTPEEQEILFGPEVMDKLKNAGVLLRSLPEKVGASDTPRGLQFRDLMSPWQNAADIGRYGLLKGKKSMPAVGRGIRGAKLPAQGLINQGLLDYYGD